MKYVVAVIISLFFIFEVCVAHQDTVIKLKGDGILEGLPSEYGPAKLQIEFVPEYEKGRAIKSINLTLGKNKVHIPECVTSKIRTQNGDDVWVSASWYHDEKYLPYYLHVDFFDPGFDKLRNFNPKVSLLFNLHNAKLMEITKMVAMSETSAEREIIDLKSLCSAEKNDNFIDKNYK